jgi:two-component system chemotaxis response regulator CheB
MSGAVMATRDIVVIAASAGGISALTELMQALDGYSGSVLVAVHMSPNSPGVLPSILERAGGITATFARDGEPLKGGHIYVARPDYHLMVKDRRIELSHGPKENGFRPAADPCFAPPPGALDAASSP